MMSTSPSSNTIAQSDVKQVQWRIVPAQYGGDPTWCQNQYIHRRHESDWQAPPWVPEPRDFSACYQEQWIGERAAAEACERLSIRLSLVSNDCLFSLTRTGNAKDWTRDGQVMMILWNS
jgi:hypothetical protein